mmetsp:Transcript_115230/g.366284  ORF Transcript_115230/g.366284 Transcript_115230/m.366284 type:complete len:230 (+) Transcript_115230:59-748(+)
MLNFGAFKEKALAGASSMAGAVSERMDVAKGGKKLVDEGGAPARAALMAKSAAKDAVAADRDTIRRMMVSAESLDTAAAKMKEAACMADVDGITGKAKFAAQAESYSKRAAAYRQAAELLSGELEGPEFTPVETDALQVVLVQGGYESAKTQTREAIGLVKQCTSADDTPKVKQRTCDAGKLGVAAAGAATGSSGYTGAAAGASAPAGPPVAPVASAAVAEPAPTNTLS